MRLYILSAELWNTQIYLLFLDYRIKIGFPIVPWHLLSNSWLSSLTNLTLLYSNSLCIWIWYLTISTCSYLSKQGQGIFNTALATLLLRSIANLCLCCEYSRFYLCESNISPLSIYLFYRYLISYGRENFFKLQWTKNTLNWKFDIFKVYPDENCVTRGACTLACTCVYTRHLVYLYVHLYIYCCSKA